MVASYATEGTRRVHGEGGVMERFSTALIAGGLLAALVAAPAGMPAPVLGQFGALPTATPGGGVAPTVTSFSPNSTSAVSLSAIAVSVAGTGFTPGAVVALEGRPLQATFVSLTMLTAIVPAGLPAGSYSATVTNPGFLSSPPLPNAFTVANLASVLYAPLAVRRSADDSTAIAVQNVSTTSTTVYLRYYDLNGLSDPQWAQSVLVTAGGAVVFDQAMDPTLPPTFEGSAVIQSAEPITGVVNHVSFSGPPAAFPFGEGGSLQGRTSAGSFSVFPSEPTTLVTVPVVFGGYNGNWTTLSVQNTGRTVATISVALYPTGAANPVATIPRTIPPLAAARVRLGPEAGVPSGFVGTAVVSSGGSTVAAVAESVHAQTNVAYTYAGITGGSTRMNAPLLFKNFNGWVTGAQVVNVSSSNIIVDANFYHRDSAISFGLPQRTLLPHESYTYYLPAIAEIPDGFVGSGVFSGTGPIAVVVQEVNADRGAGMAYAGFYAGTPNVSVPLVFKGANGWDSGIQVQNLGSVDTIATVRYYLPAGGTSFAAIDIPARESNTFYPPADANLPPGTVASALVTSINGQPIIAIVNEVNYTRAGDGSMAYEGINY